MSSHLDEIKEIAWGRLRQVSGPVALIIAGLLAVAVGGVGMIATSWMRSPAAVAAGTPAHTFQTDDLSAAPPVTQASSSATTPSRSSRPPAKQGHAASAASTSAADPVPSTQTASTTTPTRVVSPHGTAPAPQPKRRPTMSPNSVWIPSLGISVSVLSEGQSGGLATIPVGKTRVGWLNWTPSLAVHAGTTVIAGHVTYNSIPGAFYKLPKIRPGAVVYTTTSTGTVQAWRVQSAATYPKGKLPAQVWQSTGARQLALVTCTGDIGLVPKQGGYAHLDNLVVMAKPVATD